MLTSSAFYRWDPETKDLTIKRDNHLDPVNLVFDKAGDLMVFSSGGKGETVYSFRPDSPENQISILEPQPAKGPPSDASSTGELLGERRLQQYVVNEI